MCFSHASYIGIYTHTAQHTGQTLFLLTHKYWKPSKLTSLSPCLSDCLPSCYQRYYINDSTKFKHTRAISVTTLKPSQKVQWLIFGWQPKMIQNRWSIKEVDIRPRTQIVTTWTIPAQVTQCSLPPSVRINDLSRSAR